MQYYMIYTLGHIFAPGKKADKGTCVHKVLEVLAGIKKTIQDHPLSEIYQDEHIGEVSFDSKTWLDKYFLDNSEVEEVNNSRMAKSIYKTPWFIKEGHYRRGVDFVEYIFQRVYKYYSDKSTHKWTKSDERDCRNWVWMALDFRNGLYDPRMRNVYAPELRFDFQIKEDWAKYDYEVAGENISGYLGLKGTVDLITKIDDNTLEVCDWKTGQRIDWGKGGEKTYEKLCKDPQLMMYYYALSKTLPQFKNIIMTIFFIRDGGPFTVCFSPADLPKVEDMLRKRFEEIRNSQMPELISPTQSNFKCTKLCPFYKNHFVNKDPLNMCLRAKRTIEEIGIDAATEEMIHPDHKIGVYNAPG